MDRAIIRSARILAATTGVVFGTTAWGDVYSWQPVSGTNYDWNDTTRWSPNTGFPNAAGDVANVNTDLTAGQSIRLRQDITVGTLNLGDSAASGNNYAFTITNSGSETFSLTFDSGSASTPAQLNLGSTGTSTNNINSPVLLNTALAINGAGGQKLSTGATVNTNGKALTLTGGTTNSSLWTMSGDVTGAGTIIASGDGGITVSGPKAFTGTIVLNRGSTGSSNAGSMTVTGGSVASAAEIIINGSLSGGITQAGGSWHAGNNSGTSTNPGQRLTTNTVTLNGGSLSPYGQTANTGSTNAWTSGSEMVVENVNVLDFNSGFSVLATSTGGNTAGTRINVTTLERGSGASGFVRSTTLGGTSRVLVGNGGDFLIGGGGSAGNATISIIPWLGANNTSSGTTVPTGFATYIAGVGIRAIDTSTEYSSDITAGGSANVNTGTIGLGGVDRAINSLRFTNGGAQNMGSGLTLTVNSGGIFFINNGGAIGGSGSADAGTLNVGSAEAVIWTIGSATNTVGAVITGSDGLTKAGTGTLILTGANTYTGDTHVSSGRLRVGDGTYASNLGDGDVEVHNGAVLEVLSNDVIDDDASLILHQYGLFNGKIDLAAGVNETVGGLLFGSVAQANGTWGATGSGADFINDTYFAGTGVLTVVPEPASLSLLAIAGVFAMRRRRA